MKLWLRFALLAGCSCLIVSALHAEAPEEWEALFDGRSLAGWKANLHPDSFTVADGAVRAQCTSSTECAHLYFVGDEPQKPRKFVNFELLAEVRGEPNSNGGIFFHTDESVRDARKHLAAGYEVQLNSSPTEKRKTGSLYGVVDVAESPIDEREWFQVRLLVEGKRVRIWVADRLTVDYVEPELPERDAARAGRVLRPDGGAIALQAHDPQSVFYYRNIRVREIVGSR